MSHNSIDIRHDREELEDLMSAWSVNISLLFSGAVTLWYWFTIINTATYVNRYYFPEVTTMSNILTAVFEGLTLLGSLAASLIDGLSPQLSLTLIFVSFLLTLITPLLLLLPSSARVVCWIVNAGLFGILSGFAQVHYYSLAANLPCGTKTLMVSVGQGAAGVACLILSFVAHDLLNAHPLVVVIVLMSALVVVTAIGCFGSWRLIRSAVVRYHINQQRQAVADICAIEGKTSVWSLLRNGWFPLMNTFLTFFGSYLVYPNIGPFRWPSNGGETQTTYLTGVSPLAILLGRMLPSCAYFVLPIKTCFLLNIGRLIVPVLFVITALRFDIYWFGAWWYQALLLFVLAFTEGWLTTLDLIYCVSVGKNLYETSVLATLSVLAICLGLCVSLGLAPGLQAALGI